MRARIWFDGACSGNPGPMGGGAIVEIDSDRQVVSVPLGVGTNNEAEYGGLIAGLQKALELGATEVIVRGDSQLILRQLDGSYRVKAANLRRFYEQARGLLDQFLQVRLEWVPREENAAADQAARDAIQ